MFSDIETISELENNYMPRIKKFTSYIVHLEKSIEEFKEIITKFDENLSLKANKNLMVHTLKEFEIAYLKKEDQ